MSLTSTGDSETHSEPGHGGGLGGGRRRRALRPVLWRLHFFSGLLAGPIILSMALTGIVFVWNPQIESAIYSKALTAVSGAPDQPLAQQVRAAKATHPDYEVTAIVPAAPGAVGGEETTAVTLAPPDPETNRFGQDAGVTTVYVDPGSARVTGQIVEAKRPDEWIRNLHSNWRVGQKSWLEPLSETAASWVLVSLFTGLYLFWPRSRRAWAQAARLSPRRPSRARWRTVHTTMGVVLLGALLVQIGTGLTWTRFAGKWVDAAQAVVSAEAPTLSTDLAAAGPSATGQQRAEGEAGKRSTSLANVDTVMATVADVGLSAPMEITPPAEPRQAWTVASIDDRWPIDTATVAIAPASGAVIDRVTWGDQPLLGKITTLAINYHTGTLFGLANQIFLTLFAAAVIVMIVSGYRMWWHRRPAGVLGAPPRAGPLLRVVPIPLLIGFAVLMVLLPMLGVSFLIFLLVERLVRLARHRPAAATPAD